MEYIAKIRSGDWLADGRDSYECVNRLEKNMKSCSTDLLKAFHSALIIMPPSDFCEQIQDTRRQYDKAYERWMPHVNLSFPFVDPKHFDEAAAKLQASLDTSDIYQFDIHLSTFQQFIHKKAAVFWLDPLCDGDQIQRIHKVIISTYPHLDDLEKKNDTGFIPHLTCGQCALPQLPKLKEKLQKNFKNITFTCKELMIISRDSIDSPFEIKHKITLKEKKIAYSDQP